MEVEEPTPYQMSTVADNEVNTPRYSQRVCKAPVRFSINSMRRTTDIDEATVNEALDSREVAA